MGVGIGKFPLYYEAVRLQIANSPAGLPRLKGNMKTITLIELCQMCASAEICAVRDVGCHEWDMLRESQEEHLEALLKVQDDEIKRLSGLLIGRMKK